MKKFTILAVALIFTALFFNACDNTSTNPIDNNQPTPNAPTNLRASSKDGSVMLKWTASTSESNSLFAGYVLKITGGTPMAPIALTSAQNPYEVKGLENGVEYTFSLQAKYTNDSLSTPVTIKWSPATRFTLNENDAPIRVYETASSFGSGLVIFNPSTEAPKTAKVADGANWTLGLYTKNGDLKIGSPKLLDYSYGSTPGTVEIADVISGVNSIEDVYDSQALNAKNFSEKVIDLKQYSSNIVLILRHHQTGKTDWNYAKVLVKYTGGAFLQGTADNRYVELIISYQKVTGMPYAKVKGSQKSDNNSK
ncbi:MAG: fibronectin type III domain-containing protein [Candidatus Kapaibacteriota bacterium]